VLFQLGRVRLSLSARRDRGRTARPWLAVDAWLAAASWFFYAFAGSAFFLLPMLVTTALDFWLAVSGGLSLALDVTLPAGTSFYTFQTMSYVIDVYLNTPAAESSRLARGWAAAEHDAFLRCTPDAPTLSALCDALIAAEKRAAKIQLLTVPWNPAALEAAPHGERSSIEEALDPLAAALEARCLKPVRRLDHACGEADFFDAYHPRGACFAEVARQLSE
jgi:hypothetical protein